MSTYSNLEFGNIIPAPVKTLEYRDMGGATNSSGAGNAILEDMAAHEEADRRAEVALSQTELADRIKRERSDAAQQVELRLRQDYELKLQAAHAPVVAAVTAFNEQRSEYFARVEAEVVQLALAIAAKILHREAQVDPMLVASLVRMAIERLREGSSVTIRVGRGRAPRWKEYFAGVSVAARVEAVEDVSLSEHDCLLETELGVANFGLDTQLKEVEQGFFDLLALKPVIR
ncbi:MAG: FliH/SctL family protein [Terracidiphilus sp.]